MDNILTSKWYWFRYKSDSWLNQVYSSLAKLGKGLRLCENYQKKAIAGHKSRGLVQEQLQHKEMVQTAMKLRWRSKVGNTIFKQYGFLIFVLILLILANGSCQQWK